MLTSSQNFRLIWIFWESLESLVGTAKIDPLRKTLSFFLRPKNNQICHHYQTIFFGTLKIFPTKYTSLQGSESGRLTISIPSLIFFQCRSRTLFYNCCLESSVCLIISSLLVLSLDVLNWCQFFYHFFERKIFFRKNTFTKIAFWLFIQLVTS